jgi:hypothetical protein
MTNYKFFKIDPDIFYMMDEEYFREDEEVAWLKIYLTFFFGRKKKSSAF